MIIVIATTQATSPEMKMAPYITGRLFLRNSSIAT
jgi:hypothetical protein